MKKRLTALAILAIFLLLPLCFAQITQKKVGSAVISPLGEANFDIKVSNYRPTEDLFVLQLSDVAWSLNAKNAGDVTSGVFLGGSESRIVSISIKPFSTDIAPGTYYVELRVRSRETGAYSSEVFTITIDPKVVDYKLKTTAEILDPTSIDPSKTNSVKVLVKNPYPVYLSNISVEASSKFLKKVAVVDIPPKTDKVVDFTLNLDASTPKQEDILKISVKQGTNEIASTEKVLYIREYKLPYKYEETIEKLFLHTVHTITFTNTESAQKTQDASIPMIETSARLSTSPSSVVAVFDDQQFIVWKNVMLSPNESYVVTVTEDYRPVFAGIIAVILIIVGYFLVRSPVIVRKKAYGLRKKDTGNNQIKVVLHVKNRSNRFVERVRVLERLPIIHKVEPDFGPETPEPKFRRSHEGIILDWDIGLAPREERIFTYKIKSTLPIVGEYTLRPCVVQYGKRGRRTTSNPFRLLID